MNVRRRNTTDIQVFEREGHEAVTYDLSQSDCVTITVPLTSQWTSGPHWHEKHTEYLHILQGRALVRLANATKEYEAGDDIIEVPKYTVHEWQRVPGDNDGQPLVVREWTDPADGQKEIFFRMLNSFLTEANPSSLFTLPFSVPGLLSKWIESWVVMLQLHIIFQSCDNWPVLVGDDSGWRSWTATHLVLTTSSWMGACLGLKGIYIDYVDDEGYRKGVGRPNG
jgi:quercetin dioxygenase-like cupin family protein